MNKPREIGTRMESNLRDAMNEHAGRKVCERVALHGEKDHGDLRIEVDELVLTGESKHGKVYPGEKKLEAFKRQTVDENENAGQDGGVLFVNLPNKSIMRTECWMQPRTFMLLSGFDLVLRDFESDHDRSLLRRLLDTEAPWLRLTLADFMRLCWGGPAQGRSDSDD